MQTLSKVLPLLVLPFRLLAEQAPAPATILMREVRYEAALSEHEARFAVELDFEMTGRGEAATRLWEGDIAVLPARLPAGVRLVREGNEYRLVATRAGRHKCRLDLVAKITRVEPWNQISFTGPETAIASVAAQAQGAGVEVQLLAGTLQEATANDGGTRVRGFLGPERVVALRWQGKAVEVARKTLLTCETTAAAQVTPTVVKYKTDFRFEILQGAAPRLVLELPAAQTLTKLQGEGVRDWRVEGRTLTLEFIRPVEKSYVLTLWSEQPSEAAVAMALPQPLEVERESGSLTISCEDVWLETEAQAGLRQVNAGVGAWAAYQFYARPFRLGLKLRRIEPVVTVADRVSVRVEESRLLSAHALALNVEKAGIYALELWPQAGFVVTDVRGDGVEDWKSAGGKLSVSFNNRVLGPRRLEVLMERPLPSEIEIAALRVGGAARETAQIGAAAVAGLQLQTKALSGAREIPVGRLENRADETLAYSADQPAWQLKLSAERLAARIRADIFNLVAIGDGWLGGSATIRYAILNQGVQELRVRIPSQWNNIEFTGPNIRRKEQHGEVWIIRLQDKVWGGYTLVITYDQPFDPHRATLTVGGVHCEGVERETGSLAVTGAAHLQIEPAGAATRSQRRIDETELSASDRALITRPVLLAYRYEGDAAPVPLGVRRLEELPGLDAAADHTLLTSVLREDGQMLTQASFMVKNNERQFQSFTLPDGATLWACFVGGQPAKPETDGQRILVPLPRRADRDEAFPVEIVYRQKLGALGRFAPRRVALAAPKTDMQTTYAEWELFVPDTHRLSAFGGNMFVARGTTYGLRDAWQGFLRFYDRLAREASGVILWGFAVCAIVVLGARAARRTARGLVAWLVVVMIIGILGALWLPALSAAREKARRSQSLSNLKQIGLSLAMYAERHGGQLPASLDSIQDTVGSERVFYDVSSGQPFTYVGAGRKWQDAGGEAVIAYSYTDQGGNVLFSDGKVSWLDARAINDALGRTVGGSGPLTVAGPAAPTGMAGMVAGLRPIRIELPKAGQRLVFTKVLNVRGEALSVRALAMERAVFNAVRGAMQAGAFVVGLALVAWHGRRARPSSLGVALGIALALGAVIHGLIAWRVLHVGMIIAAPLAAGAGLAGLARRFWKNRAGSAPEAPPAVPPVAAAMVLLWVGATAAEADASVGSADYTGKVMALEAREAAVVAQFDAVIALSATRDNERVPLFGEEVAVREFTASPATVKLVREGKTVSAFVPRKGPATVKVKFLVKTAGDAARRQVAFAIPPALSSRVSVTLEEPQATVEMPTAVSFKTTPSARQTQVDAVLGAAGRVELNWTPRVKRAAEMAATVFCQNASLVSLGGGVLNVRCRLDYQVAQGELRQLRVALPAAQRLMRVEGESVRTWKLDGQTLVVELVKGVTPSYRLTVETERALDGPTADVETPHALDVQRETGLVALKPSEELAVSVESVRELQKVDVDEFARIAGGAAAAAYRFLRPEFALSVRVEPMQPHIEVAVRNQARLGPEGVRLQATLDYTIKRAGVFRLRLAVPDGYRVERVTGSNVAQWAVATSSGEQPHTLEVTLQQRTLGAYTLTVELLRSLPQWPKTLRLAGVRPLEAQKLTGFVSVSAEEGVQVKTSGFDGLTEAPAGASGELAFKLIPDAGDWTLAVATEQMESWVRAEVFHAVTLAETLVSGRSQVRYEIQNAPAGEFRVRVPAAFRNVEVNGPNIRRKDRDPLSGEWRVELQNKVRGAYTLSVTWDAPWDSASGEWELAGVEAAGVERESGAVAVFAPSRFRIEKKTASADVLDARELPPWAGPLAEAPVLSYRYLRPGYKIVLGVQRFEEAELLQALVDNVRLTSVVSEDGQMMTEMALAVRNNARQHLEVTLPNDAELWSAFVAGQPVRPGRRDGKLLLPMQRSDSDATVAVELTYVSREPFPARRGKVHLETPALDVPLKNARWELYLPPDYAYGDFAGTMKREMPAAAAAPAAMSSWSLTEYAVQERVKKVARDTEASQMLGSVRMNLSTGKLKEASESLSRARQTMQGEELRLLEKDVSRAGAQNLVQAQQSFVVENAGVAGGRYDEAAAEQQWAKLQAAQQIAVAKARPLRINLPKRGLYVGFAQVLQTEMGKPMTLQFAAVNLRASAWPSQLVLGAAGFAALWLIVAGILARRAPEERSQT